MYVCVYIRKKWHKKGSQETQVIEFGMAASI